MNYNYQQNVKKQLLKWSKPGRGWYNTKMSQKMEQWNLYLIS